MNKVFGTLKILIGFFIIILTIAIGLDFSKMNFANGYSIIGFCIAGILSIASSVYLFYSGFTELLNKSFNRLFLIIGLCIYFFITVALGISFLTDDKSKSPLFKIFFICILFIVAIDEYLRIWKPKRKAAHNNGLQQ